MPPLLVSVRYAVLVALILSIGKVMPSCSYYVEKGLVYIMIAAPSSRQPLSYAKCIKLNMCVSCNVCFVLSAKYMYCSIFFSCLVLCLSCHRVLDLIRC